MYIACSNTSTTINQTSDAVTYQQSPPMAPAVFEINGFKTSSDACFVTKHTIYDKECKEEYEEGKMKVV